MKKIITTILLVVMALSLFSCAKPELYKMDFTKISSVVYGDKAQTTADKKEFINAYNKAKVTKAYNNEDIDKSQVVVAVFTNGTDQVTLFYLGENEFCVTGSVISESYYIEAPELAKVYKNDIDPDPEFVKIEGTYEAALVKKPDGEIDTAAFIKYYNDSKLTAKAKDEEKSNDTVVLVCDDGETTFSFSYLGDNLFRVSGSEIKVDYIIESKGLADLYTEAVK